MTGKGHTASARGPTVTVPEVREFFCCPYIWWLGNRPRNLEQRERLARLMQEPDTLRARTLPLRVTRAGFVKLFAIAAGATALITWVLLWYSGRSGAATPVIFAVNWLAFVLTFLTATAAIDYYVWWRRTPFYLRPMPGSVIAWEQDEARRPVIRDEKHGLAGTLDCILRQGDKLAAVEVRSVVTPKRLSTPDRMQAVAKSLLAESAFGQRPERLYIVYPDRTFEVRPDAAEERQLLDAVRTMREARRTGRLPDASPAWHLCPTCPLTDCPARMAEPGPSAV